MIFFIGRKDVQGGGVLHGAATFHGRGGRGEIPACFCVLVGEYTQKLHDSLKEAVMPQIEAGKVRPFVLALYGPIEWDADYSPWYATALQGREFGRNAPQYLVLYNTGYCRI